MLSFKNSVEQFGFSLLLYWSLFSLVARAAEPEAFSAEKLNILLITCDDLGLQLSCYGDPIAQTPELDSLAHSAVQFTTAYVSQASCSPSRSTMFTGLYPHGNGHYGLANAGVGFRLHENLLDDVLPNVLKRNGYRTGIIGKLHVNPEEAFAFDMNHKEGFGSREVRQQLDYAKEFLSAGNNQPWFLMFNLFDPHVARERRDDGSRGPQYFPDTVRGLPDKPLSAADITPWPWQQIDHPQQLEKIAGYYNCVHRIDAAIGMLMGLLDERGFSDNTLIIFLGDHGPPFARGKTSCYESGLRVPFIVRWPGVSKPHRSERLVGSIDIYPTILDAAGVEPPAGLHGASLRSILDPETGKLADWRSTLVAEFHFHGASPFFPRRAITDGRFKLIHNIRAGELSASNSIDGDQAYNWSRNFSVDNAARIALDRLADPPEWELYDLENDPIEFHNVSGSASLKNAEQRLRESLSQWQQETNDPFVDEQFRKEVEAKFRRQ